MEIKTPIIWIMGNSLEICQEFSRQSGCQHYASVQFNDNVTIEQVRLHQASNEFYCSDTGIIAKSVMLKYFKLDWTRARLQEARNITYIGMINLINADDISSIKNAIDTIDYIQDYMPYIVAVKYSSQRKSWHEKIKILTDESTLTYDPKDKDSIKRVWMEMIRRFELDNQLEQRFLDCIESKV